MPKPGEIAYGRGSVAARGHCVAWINPVANAGEAFFRASAGVNPLRGVWDRVGDWVGEWFTHWTVRWPPVEGPGILAWARHLLKPLTLDTEQTRPINGRRQSKRTAMGLAGARIRVLSGAGGCPRGCGAPAPRPPRGPSLPAPAPPPATGPPPLTFPPKSRSPSGPHRQSTCVRALATSCRLIAGVLSHIPFA